MKKTPSRAALLEAENKFLRNYHGASNLTRIIQDLIKYGGYVAIAAFAWLSIDSLAGKTTSADIAINANASASVTPQQAAETDHRPSIAKHASDGVFVVGLLIGFAGIVYGRRQAALRRETVERFHPYQEQAERQLDTKRTSSRLTESGETRPEDK